MPVTGRLKAELDLEKQRQTHAFKTVSPHSTILKTSSGTAWTGDGFRTTWNKVRVAAGITELTFHDLRGTAITNLANAGCTLAEIVSVTGHTMEGAQKILEAHYLAKNSRLATSAIKKLERDRANSQMESQMA